MRFTKITLPDIGACTFEEEETENFQEVWEELEESVRKNSFKDPIEKELFDWIEKRDFYGMAVLWNLYEDICKKCIDYENQSDRVKEFFEGLYLSM